ncbi:uncharacterized protein LOC132048862 [Lycium ferocissimum]|uniref:uncharacterized protein LOC132048862 n=1 Tax=Lycium ferocissimum TaxID=112874 RepID=UPI00281588DD|nr:uncharacterized protein LOC132048862 [Lycium ferocissimum]
MARTRAATAKSRGAGRGATPVGGGVPAVDAMPLVAPNEAAGDATAPAQPAVVPASPGAAAAPGLPDAMAQVLNWLHGLAQTGAIPAVLAGRGVGIVAPGPDRVQAPGVQHAATVALRLDEVLSFEAFLRPVAGPVMTGEEHDLFGGSLR